MLTKVEVRTNQGALLILPLQDYSEGYAVQEIEGLDPVKATLVSSSFALMDGAQYQSSRRESRNIKLTLGLEPVYSYNSVQDLRSRLYSFFMPKSLVSLRFYMSNGLTVDILGRVESLESVLFTQEPEVTISLLCFNPDFVALSSVVVSGVTVADATEQAVPYSGSVETGFIFRLAVNRAISEFMLYNRAPGGEFYSLEFNAPLITGDLLEISTISGAKGAYLTRGGLPTSILYGISPPSTWLNLYPGSNNVRVLAPGAPIPFTIEYSDRYGGL